MMKRITVAWKSQEWFQKKRNTVFPGDPKCRKLGEKRQKGGERRPYSKATIKHLCLLCVVHKQEQRVTSIEEDGVTPHELPPMGLLCLLLYWNLFPDITQEESTNKEGPEGVWRTCPWPLSSQDLCRSPAVPMTSFPHRRKCPPQQGSLPREGSAPGTAGQRALPCLQHSSCCLATLQEKGRGRAGRSSPQARMLLC